MRYYRGLPGTLPPASQLRDLTDNASHPRKSDSRDLTEVALSGPSITHPDTIRPHLGLK
jgi:hypothetical protein